jgi:integrase
MKAQDRHHDHKIILCSVIATELREWRKSCPSKRWVCPGRRTDQHVTREAVEKVYRTTLGLADKHSPHGWRAAFSTLARDAGVERDVVELALDHIHDNEVVRAYDRGQRLHQRVKLMSWWGEELARAHRGGEVLVMKRLSG